METTEFNHVLPEEGYLNDLDIERDYKLDLLLGKVDLLLEQQSYEMVFIPEGPVAAIVTAAVFLSKLASNVGPSLWNIAKKHKALIIRLVQRRLVGAALENQLYSALRSAGVSSRNARQIAWAVSRLVARFTIR